MPHAIHSMRMAALTALVLISGVVDSGAQTADAYIGQLVRPGAGDDSKPRLELRGLTNKGFRPGAEGERSAHETALLKGLSTRAEWEVKSFLIDELALQGKTAAVVPVAAYLGDVNLCDPASRALQMMAATEGAEKVLPVLRAAMAGSTGKCRVALVNALGGLRDREAATVDALIKDATSADRDLRAVAGRALANIGDAKAEALLAERLKAADLFERNRAVSLNLLLALRLAEQGLKSQAQDIANAVKAWGSDGNRKNVVIHADSILAMIGRTVPIAAAPKEGGSPAPFRLRPGSQGIQVSVLVPGPFTLRLIDLRGKVFSMVRGEGSGEYLLPSRTLEAGLYLVMWENGRDRLPQAVLLR